MFAGFTLAVGFAAGYLTGAKAGKERYAQMEAMVGKSSRRPAVQQLPSNISSTASVMLDKVRSVVTGPVPEVSVGPSSGSAGSASNLATSGTANSSDSALIDELSDSELDLLTTPEPPR